MFPAFHHTDNNEALYFLAILYFVGNARGYHLSKHVQSSALKYYAYSLMSSAICTNKKATFDYVLTSQYESGLVLQGWEVKSLRAGKVQLRDAYYCYS